MPDTRPALLIISFSDIANDARVKKQVLRFADQFRVTTCGFGDPVREDIEHVGLSSDESIRDARIEAALLHSRAYRAAYWRQPYVRRARAALRGRGFDAVIANDLETVGLAVRDFGGERVHADLHEFFPGLHDQSPAWVKLRRPFLEWQIREFATRTASVTTVSDTIADRYLSEYGVRCEVVRNASPAQPLRATPVASPIRLVHSGGAQPNRRIEVMMRAAAASTADVTLDLYLTHEKSPYGEQLRALADELGERVTIHPPVAQAELVRTLNGYDVGIHVLPPTNTNNALALPNKFFDFVQARLGMVIGPTADMARLLEQYELGAVADDFDVAAVARVLDGLTVARVAEWKEHAEAAADELSAERQYGAWERGLAAITEAARSAAGAAPAEPLVDVVIAVHTPARPIERPVASVLDHTAAPIRVTVVVHNTDPEPIRERLRAYLDDPRLRIVTWEDGIRSPSGPMNRGFDLATAPYVSLLGSDDSFEPGALDAWLRAAGVELGWVVGSGSGSGSGASGTRLGITSAVIADAVIAPARDGAGRLHPSPPVRLSRVGGADGAGAKTLDGVRDRLAYRAAPLGLIGRAKFGHLRFAEGIETGEDQPFSAELWFTPGSRVVFPAAAPGYREHHDQHDRVTFAERSVATEFRVLDTMLAPGTPWSRNDDVRLSLAAKLIRVHLFDAVRSRVGRDRADRDRDQADRDRDQADRDRTGSGSAAGEGAGNREAVEAVKSWNRESAEQLAGIAERILAWEPRAPRVLARVDEQLLEALRDPATPETELASLLAARARLRTPGALLPKRLSYVLHPQAPLRFHAAGVLLARRCPPRR
ncbi:MAG: glycosyltransferase [Leucobacter sp.]